MVQPTSKITATIGGRKRRLVTPKQWRAAIVNGELERGSQVIYEAPGAGPVETTAGECAELAPLFDEILGPVAAKPVGSGKEGGEPEKDSSPVSAEPPKKGKRKAKPAPAAAAAAAAAKPSTPPPPPAPPEAQNGHEAVAAQPAAYAEEQRKIPPQLWLVVGIVALILLGMAFGGDDEAETDSGFAVNDDAALPPAYDTAPEEIEEAAEELPLEEVDVPEPQPTPERTRQPNPRETAAAEPAPPRPVATSADKELPPPARSLARPVTPNGQARWSRRIIENYPARAIRQELEGTVGIRVNVDTSGRVANCSVVSSSGHAILDSSACDSVTRYARFNPALDDNGNPIPSSWSTSIVYRLN